MAEWTEEQSLCPKCAFSALHTGPGNLIGCPFPFSSYERFLHAESAVHSYCVLSLFTKLLFPVCTGLVTAFC